MEFYRRTQGQPKRIGILPGSFNPPTIAHVELIEAARRHVDEVVCVIPRVFPHKEYFGATLDQRLNMLGRIHPDLPYSIAVTDRGLFIDIARECRSHYDRASRLYFLCGADAAERIVTWDYGESGVIDEMLNEFELLVAPRVQLFAPPIHLRDRIHPVTLREGHQLVSSTGVRERILRREPWEHLVPREIHEEVRAIYS